MKLLMGDPYNKRYLLRKPRNKPLTWRFLIREKYFANDSFSDMTKPRDDKDGISTSKEFK